MKKWGSSIWDNIKEFRSIVWYKCYTKIIFHKNLGLLRVQISSTLNNQFLKWQPIPLNCARYFKANVAVKGWVQDELWWMLPCFYLGLTVSRLTWLVRWFEPLFSLIVKLVPFKSLHSEIYVFFSLILSSDSGICAPSIWTEYSGRFQTVSDKIWQYVLSSEPRTRRTRVGFKSLVLQPRAPKACGYKIVWPVDGWRPGGTRIETGSTEYVSSLLATLTFAVCFCHSECSVHPLIGPPITASTPLVSGSLLYATQPLYHFFSRPVLRYIGQIIHSHYARFCEAPLPLPEWSSS